MTESHTPGPWTFKFDESGGYDCMTDSYDVHAANGLVIASLDLGFYGQRMKQKAGDLVRRAECEANARLIAAAPELLAALKGLRALIIGECGASTLECFDGEQADAAILKAEGRL